MRMLLLIQRTHSKMTNIVAPENAVIFECVERREIMDACVGWLGELLGIEADLCWLVYPKGDRHNKVYHLMPLIFLMNNLLLQVVGATGADLKEAANGAVKTIVDSWVPLKEFQMRLDQIHN